MSPESDDPEQRARRGTSLTLKELLTIVTLCGVFIGTLTTFKASTFEILGGALEMSLFWITTTHWSRKNSLPPGARLMQILVTLAHLALSLSLGFIAAYGVTTLRNRSLDAYLGQPATALSDIQILVLYVRRFGESLDLASICVGSFAAFSTLAFALTVYPAAHCQSARRLFMLSLPGGIFAAYVFFCEWAMGEENFLARQQLGWAFRAIRGSMAMLSA
jgi:hypothetical protein